MRVKCSTTEDFLINLKAFSVYNNVIYFERAAFPINGTSQRDATAFEIRLSLSAIVDHDDGGQALVESEDCCGIDRLSVDGDKGGTDSLNEKMKNLMKFCNEQKYKLLPGVLDI